MTLPKAGEQVTVSRLVELEARLKLQAEEIVSLRDLHERYRIRLNEVITERDTFKRERNALEIEVMALRLKVKKSEEDEGV